MICLSLLLGGLFLFLFILAARSGQFEDMEASKYEMLRLTEETWRKENGIR
ncbi:MAG: cbb3-type cytochrome oxidase assembly protein CcoS [Planctomycetota bacterium]